MKNRKRNRMKGFDYSSDNLYFVTICVQDRVCCFGAVRAGRDLPVRDLSVHHSQENHPDEFNIQMQLNEFGKIVYDRMLWLAEQYKYVVIHNFVVMPNHVHAIIEIDSAAGTEGTGRDLSVPDLSVQQMKIKSLSSLIGAFKTTSSKIIHESGFLDFAWQRSFHDHIIRNEQSYLNISNYIDTNPEKWMADTFHEEHQNNSNCVG